MDRIDAWIFASMQTMDIIDATAHGMNATKA